MTVPIRMFSYTDPGAPQLVVHNPYSFFQVMLAVLVGNNGIAYGNKASAGWTLYAEDRAKFKLVIQQAGGNKRFLQFSTPKNQVLGSSNNYWSVTARMYEMMNDIDSGTNQIPNLSYSQYSEWGIPPFNSGVPGGSDTGNFAAFKGAVPWWIICDDRFFYLKMDPVYSPTAQVNNCIYFFGDLEKASKTDPYATILWSYTAAQTYGGNGYRDIVGQTPNNSTIQASAPFYMTGSASDAANPNLWIMRSLAQSPQAPIGPICSLVYNQTFSNMGWNTAQPMIQNSYYNKRQTLSPGMVVEVGVMPRGYLPGLHYPSMQGLSNYGDNWQFTDQNGTPWILWQSWNNSLAAQSSLYPNNTQAGGANYVNVLIRLDTWRDTWEGS